MLWRARDKSGMHMCIAIKLAHARIREIPQLHGLVIVGA